MHSEDWSLDQITDVTDTIVAMVLSESKANKCKRAKHYWNKDLSSLCQQKRYANKQWVNLERPRGPGNRFWIAYQKAKTDFRNEQRRAQKAKDAEFLLESERHATLDQRAFWSLLSS